jgi:hypothetical protein
MPGVLHVAHHPDDLHPARLRRERDIDPAPQRILVGPVAPGGGRIDDDHVRRPLGIAIGEHAPANERDAERREVVSAHETRTRAHRNGRLGRPPLNPESGAAADVDEGKRRGQRRGFHVRQRADPLEQCLVEP